jgi:hypothetical protein
MSSTNKSLEQFKKDVYLKYGDEYEVLSPVYLNRNEGMMQLKHNKCGFNNILKQSNKVLDKTMTAEKLCPICNPNGSKSNRLDVFQFTLDQIYHHTIILDMTQQQLDTLRHNSTKNRKYLDFKCLICNNKWSTSFTNVKKHGCLECNKKKVKYDTLGRKITSNSINTQDVNSAIKEKTNSEYELASDYHSYKSKIRILHHSQNDDHIYETTYKRFQDGGRCPICKQSKGESRISNFLQSHHIKYIPEKQFSDCIDKKPLPFDFYLEDYNICIEYDGEQHFKEVNYGDNSQSLNQYQYHDYLKDEYCMNNNIRLLRIKYTNYDNIEDILTRELKL